MIKEQFSRTARLYGEDAMEKLSRSSVLLFGVGGVGSYVAESLARAGVGRMCLVDSDEVCESNINRQAMALHSTIGKKKAEVMAERMMDINPDMIVDAKTVFYLPENAYSIDFSGFDAIADCIDTVTAKLEIISRAQSMGTPIISAMGTGNKMRPDMLEITDIFKTEGCPLARVMRKELRERGIKHLKVVYSKEKPKCDGERTPASSPFVPNSAGLLMASEIVNMIIGGK